jgi:acyl dehydratase
MPPRSIESIDALRAQIGQEIGVSDWVTVTQEMIDAFAQTTGDHQWIHVDVERARRESPFQSTIAHGFLTLSLITQLHSGAVSVDAGQAMGINYGLNRVRFVNPVRAGSRVRGHSKVLGVDEFAEGVQVTWQISVELENIDKPALVAEWVTRVYW